MKEQIIQGFELSILLCLIALLGAVVLTPIYTHFAYKYKFWKKQRKSAVTGEKLTVFNKLHAKKFRRPLPTIAGIIMLVVVTLTTLFFNLDRRQTWLPLAAFVVGGLVGLVDDIINVFGDGKGVAGLRSSIKFTMILALGTVLGLFFFIKLGYNSIFVPFFGSLHVGWLIVPIFAFAVVATGNAVNISDGLDGLAGGLSAIAFFTYGIIALLQGNGLLAAFCMTVVGTLFSYLWFNVYPARFMMGDTGAFALGTALGVVAMFTDSFLLLPIIGVVFVVEAGSSLIQIISKKFFHRRIFISAPLHQHIQAKGWPEMKITARFWLIGIGAAVIGLLVAIMGGHIR
ncbi:MAG: phospho-N-acetylmuramoyl-pentapeptide-transferase [Candidatus Nanosyncoccaceae bacterium]|jgi:phospho-N-acetylmuramoyl-pentapeptide-transferase